MSDKQLFLFFMLLTAAMLLFSGCSSDVEAPKKEPVFYTYDLTLYSDGKIVRTFKRTEVKIWSTSLIEFKDDNGKPCYWGGDFLATENK